MTSADLLASCLAPTTKSVFFLGSFESRVTLLAQQVRAINLVDAILEKRIVREAGAVAIIGGGAAGVTAAAAFALAAPNLEAIDIYERKAELLHLQRDSHDRFLHPFIYDWPLKNSLRTDAGLPFLNWHAAPAGDVAAAIEDGFNEIKRRRKIINEKLRNDVERLTPAPSFPGCRVFVKDGPKDGSAFYDAVILAIGFGYEFHMTQANHSYWAPSPLSGPIRIPGNEHVIFVSGNGDGGLVDFMMAAYNHIEHRDLFTFITEYPDLAAVEQILLDIEERAWASGTAINIYDEYRRIVMPALPQHMLLDVQDRLRGDARIWFHTRCAHLFRRDTAILNRFAAFLAIAADEYAGLNRIHVRVGKDFVGGPPLGEQVHVDGDPVMTPDLRFLRLGVKREQNLEPFQALADAFQAAAVARPAGFRPATPSLTATAAQRFAAFAPELPTKPPVASPDEVIAMRTEPRVCIRIMPRAGEFSWSGDVSLDDAGLAWKNDINILEVICGVAPNEAEALVSAVARLCGHASRCELRCRDRRRWDETIRGFSGRALPGPDVEWHFEVLEARPGSEEPNEAALMSATALSERIHMALDDYISSELNSNLFACLRQDPPAEIGWIIDEALRRLMWAKWQTWEAEFAVDKIKRRRFLLLLATERDEVDLPDEALVRLGPKIMRPHLLRAAVFALAFASCSNELFSPTNAYPGNVLSPSIAGHASGISWIDGRDLDPGVTSRNWTTGLVLLSELKASFEFLRRQQPRLDRLSDDLARISDVGAGEQPIIFGCDHEFRLAMEAGVTSVSAYISAALVDSAASAAGQLEQ